MKRWISLALAAVLALSLAVPAAAAEFPDLPEDYWAYDFMQDLYNRGIFSGYSDGTIRPLTKATVAQTLALLSRFYDLTDTELEYLYADYGPTVESILPASNEWVFDEVAVCLAAGIITEDELRAYDDLNALITREELCVYLVRTMQLEDEALSRDYASLSFTDSEEISSDALFHIDLLVSMEIISGYSDGSFDPHGTSTRAVVAKLISLSLDYLEENQVELTIPEYDNLTRASGLLERFDGSAVCVRGADGLVRQFNRTSASTVTVNGAAGTLSSAYLGSWVTVDAQGLDADTIAVTYNDASDWVQGEVLYLASAAATGDYIAVAGEDGETVRCTVSSSTVYTAEDGSSTTYQNIQEGDLVTVGRRSSVAERVYIYASERTLTGQIIGVSYAVDSGTLLVSSDNTVWSFALDYASLPMITSGGITASLSALSTGDTVTLTVEAGTLTAVSKQSVAAEYSGTLSYIGQSSTQTEWTLLLTDGSTITAPLSAGATIQTSTGSTLALSAVTLGDTLTVTLHDGVITSIVRTAQASTGDGTATVSVSGTVLYVDTTANSMLALVDGAPITFTLRSARLQNTSGTTVQLRSITNGTTFQAYGSYADAATIAATLVIFN